MNRTLPLALTLALVLALPGVTSEEGPADVTILVDAPPKLLSPFQDSFTWSLTLSWAEASALNTTGAPTALDLLAHIAAANDATYTLDWYDLTGDGTPDSAFVDEINGVSSDFTLILAGTFWALYHNDESSHSAANVQTAGPGDTIRFAYTGWPADL